MVTLTAGNRRLLFLAAALLALPSGGSAAETAAADRELESIATQRDAAEAAFRSRVAECQRQFFVTSCVDGAKAERRDTIGRLRARQRGIDEARRRERAAARSQSLQQRSLEGADRRTGREVGPGKGATVPAARQQEPRKAGGPPERAAASGPREPTPLLGGVRSRPAAPSTAERQASEIRSRASFESRRQEAAEHRGAVKEREALRALQRPGAAPLAVPESASAVRPAPN